MHTEVLEACHPELKELLEDGGDGYDSDDTGSSAFADDENEAADPERPDEQVEQTQLGEQLEPERLAEQVEPTSLHIAVSSSSGGSGLPASSSSGGGTASSSSGSVHITANNCTTAGSHIDSVGELSRLLPDFKCTHRWEIKHTRDGTDTLGQIRCIAGQSLRCVCNVHKGGDVMCKMHLNIDGSYEGCEAELVKWQIYGSTCDAGEHMREASRLQSRWKHRKDR